MKHNRTRRTVLLSVAAIFVLLAAACGDDSDDADTVSDSGATTTTAPAADDGQDAEPSGADDSAGDSGSDDSGADDGAGDDASGGDASQSSGDDPTGADDSVSTEPEAPMVLTASWRGVTEDTITVGVSMLNFDLLKELGLSQAGWGDQQGVFQAFVDDINANGGVNGRMIVPVYDYYSPISAEDSTRACTVLTQDNEVFAVLLGFVGPSGTEDPCFPGTNETVLVGGELTQDELDRANELSPSGQHAPWFTVEPSVEAQTETLLGLLKQLGGYEDAKVFVVSHQSSIGGEGQVLDELADNGFEVVGNAPLDADDGDHPAQDAIMQVISERIRADGADTVLINGNPTAVLRGLHQNALLSDVAVWSNDAAGLNNLGASIDKQVARGVLASEGPSEDELYVDPLMQQCVEVARAALPDADIKAPSEIEGAEENYFNPIRRYCGHLYLFVAIATAAGADLTPETFEAAAYTLTDFALPGVPANSLAPGKLGARDLFRLSAFDPDVGNGQLVPVTDVIDIYP